MMGMMNGSVLLAALWMALGITQARGLVHHTQVRLVPPWQTKGAVPLMSSSTRIFANHLPSSARTRPTSTKTKLFSAISNENTPPSGTSKSHSRCAIGYGVCSAAHLLQIGLAIRRGGVTVAVANSAGGPLLASGLTYLLATAAAHNRFSRDTIKRLNGLMVLYSFLGLILVGLVPQFRSFFGWLWFGTSLSSLWISVLGYVRGVREQGNTFSTETLRLTTEAQKTTFAKPHNLASLAYSCALAVIAARKGLLGLEIFNLALSSSSSITIAIKMSRLAKLTILGGTTVILKDGAHRGRTHSATFCFLNLLSSITFASTAAFDFQRYTTTWELVESIVFAAVALVNAGYAIHGWWRQRGNKSSKSVAAA